jgi:hypothetical protein
MKKFIIPFIMALMVFSNGMAQTQKGNWLLGGSLSFNSYKQGESKATIIDFSPNAGYFVIDDLALGVNLSFQSVKPEDEDATTSLAIGPMVRYYFVDLGNKAKLFGQANVGFGNEKYPDFGGGDVTLKFTEWGIKAGPAFFLTPSVALELAIGYGSRKYKDADDALNNFGLSVGFQFHLGGGGSTSKE